MTCIPSGSLAEKEIMPEMEIFTIFPILAINISKSYMWTTKKNQQLHESDLWGNDTTY